MATEIPCPAPEQAKDYAVPTAPKEIYSVDHTAVDSENEYSFLIDLNYGDFLLDAVVLTYSSGDKILLLTSVKPLRLETQAAVNIIVDTSISEEVRLYWVYTEYDTACPEMVRFEYRFAESRPN